MHSLLLLPCCCCPYFQASLFKIKLKLKVILAKKSVHVSLVFTCVLTVFRNIVVT